MTPDEPLVRYGLTAGAERAGAIFAVRERGALDGERSPPVTIKRAIEALTNAGARFALAELPDTPDVAPTSDALLARGFSEAGRVADFVDDGVDLRLLILPLRSTE